MGACHDAGRAGDGACLGDSDCAAGLCRVSEGAVPADLAPLDLSCGAAATGAGEGEACAIGSDCARGLCVVAGTCRVPCGRDADCTGDGRCAHVFARTGVTALQPAFACIPRFTLPADVVATREGIVELAAGDAETDVLLPGLGPNGLAIVSPECDVTALGVYLRTRDEPTTVLFDVHRSGDPALEPPLNPIAAAARPLTALLPNGSLSVLSEAGYSLRVRSGGGGPAEVVTLERAARGTTLDLDLYYVGGRGLRPEGVRGPAGLAPSVDALESILAVAAIALGEVRQHDVVGGLLGRHSVIERAPNGAYDELSELFALTAGAPSPSVSVFLVRSIDGAIGFSGGVPGPAGITGSDGSGIAIGLDLLPTLSALDTVLAHEVGHYLGLFHTTEPAGLVLEPLSDTPACSRDRDADGNGILTAEECAGAGADNLMFWATSGEALSEQQMDVLGRSFLLR